jgi:hypothetical protein
MTEIKTLTDLLSRIHPQSDMLQACLEALPDVIGDNALFVNTATGETTGVDGGENLDIARLLAVAEKALLAYEHATPKRRKLLIALAQKAVNRALWVSDFDPTNPEHTK